jgi:hypothetical protein
MSVDGQQKEKRGGSQAAQKAPDKKAQDRGGPGPAAPGGWFNCTVNRTGPAENGNIYVHLREAGNQFDRWYIANSTIKKEMLATALTAISAQLRVSAQLSTTDEYGTINRLFLTR